MYRAVKRTITVPNTGTAASPGNINKEVVSKNCAPFTDCMIKRNNMQIDNTNDIDFSNKHV